MRLLISFLFSSIILLSSDVFAQPDGRFGVIDIYSYGQPNIVIDDINYRLALGVSVFGKDGKKAVRTVLKPGAKILFRSNWRGETGTVTEIRILPENAQRSSFERKREGG